MPKTVDLKETATDISKAWALYRISEREYEKGKTLSTENFNDLLWKIKDLQNQLYGESIQRNRNEKFDAEALAAYKAELEELDKLYQGYQLKKDIEQAQKQRNKRLVLQSTAGALLIGAIAMTGVGLISLTVLAALGGLSWILYNAHLPKIFPNLEGISSFAKLTAIIAAIVATAITLATLTALSYPLIAVIAICAATFFSNNAMPRNDIMQGYTDLKNFIGSFLRKNKGQLTKAIFILFLKNLPALVLSVPTAILIISGSMTLLFKALGFATIALAFAANPLIAILLISVFSLFAFVFFHNAAKSLFKIITDFKKALTGELYKDNDDLKLFERKGWRALIYHLFGLRHQDSRAKWAGVIIGKVLLFTAITAAVAYLGQFPLISTLVGFLPAIFKVVIPVFLGLAMVSRTSLIVQRIFTILGKVGRGILNFVKSRKKGKKEIDDTHKPKSENFFKRALHQHISENGLAGGENPHVDHWRAAYGDHWHPYYIKINGKSPYENNLWDTANPFQKLYARFKTAFKLVVNNPAVHTAAYLTNATGTGLFNYANLGDASMLNKVSSAITAGTISYSINQSSGIQKTKSQKMPEDTASYVKTDRKKRSHRFFDRHLIHGDKKPLIPRKQPEQKFFNEHLRALDKTLSKEEIPYPNKHRNKNSRAPAA
jgi:hypothetical protein